MSARQLCIDLGYRARPQFVPFHARKERWGCIVAHRRAGKTVACIMDLVDMALRAKLDNARYAYLAPHYNQAKDVAWGYLKQYTAPIPNTTHNESELRVDLPNGARIRLYGADNYDRLRGVYFDGVILDEYGDMDPRAWPEVIRPALSDRKGWAIFIGTPKGRNAFYETWEMSKSDPEWFSLMLKASETGILNAEELADAAKTMTLDQFKQEYECSFEAAIQGAYYGKEFDTLTAQGRIRSVPWEPTSPVFTAWDLGINDATVVWFAQVIGNEVRLIDYYKVSGQSLVDTARDVLMKPYAYGAHYLPHDVELRELMTAKSRRDVLESLGLRPVHAGTAQPVQEGINTVKMMLPRCVFDAEKCKEGIEALRHYRSEFDEKNKVFRPRPLHDWASHDADAFRELAMQLRPVTQPDRPRRAKVGTLA
jgi:phage terminase large subunit